MVGVHTLGIVRRKLAPPFLGIAIFLMGNWLEFIFVSFLAYLLVMLEILPIFDGMCG